MAPKKRIEIRPEVAARVLFLSDRTCCVCRRSGKPVQIHHVDEDPSHSELGNLAVLCLDCHNDTQLRGGFARKLEADQVILYRDDWHRVVARARASVEMPSSRRDTRDELALALSIAEIYRENGEFELLAMHYHRLGNVELRDKYIELTLQRGPNDSSIAYLRGLQRKPELIPEEVIERELARYAQHDDKLQRARFLRTLGRHRQAALDYAEGSAESLRQGRTFSAAFYLKELAKSGIVTELFVEALGEATREGDLWWQVRALQELGWDKELSDLLERHAAEIEEGGNLMLQSYLADARGDSAAGIVLRKALAAGSSLRQMVPETSEADEEANS
jgi:hypothetical protein